MTPQASQGARRPATGGTRRRPPDGARARRAPHGMERNPPCSERPRSRPLIGGLRGRRCAARRSVSGADTARTSTTFRSRSTVPRSRRPRTSTSSCSSATVSSRALATFEDATTSNFAPSSALRCAACSSNGIGTQRDLETVLLNAPSAIPRRDTSSRTSLAPAGRRRKRPSGTIRAPRLTKLQPRRAARPQPCRCSTTTSRPTTFGVCRAAGRYAPRHVGRGGGGAGAPRREGSAAGGDPRASRRGLGLDRAAPARVATKWRRRCVQWAMGTTIATS